MIRITIDFDDHHYGSARELRMIINENWPAKLVTVTEESQFDVYKPVHTKKGCEFCKEVNDAEVRGSEESGAP